MISVLLSQDEKKPRKISSGSSASSVSIHDVPEEKGNLNPVYHFPHTFGQWRLFADAFEHMCTSQITL